MGSLSLRFPHKIPLYTSLLLHSATCPVDFILLELVIPNNVDWEDSALSSPFYSLHHCTITGFHTGPNILHSIFKC
jgi:hypothetical protein